jgi:hypothetical protein
MALGRNLDIGYSVPYYLLAVDKFLVLVDYPYAPSLEDYAPN